MQERKGNGSVPREHLGSVNIEAVKQRRQANNSGCFAIIFGEETASCGGFFEEIQCGHFGSKDLIVLPFLFQHLPSTKARFVSPA